MQENTDWLINRENSIGNSKEIYVRGKKVGKIMEDKEDIKEKLKKIEFSIRMLHFHNYINDTQFFNMMRKLQKQKREELRDEQ